MYTTGKIKNNHNNHDTVEKRRDEIKDVTQERDRQRNKGIEIIRGTYESGIA